MNLPMTAQRRAASLPAQSKTLPQTRVRTRGEFAPAPIGATIQEVAA